MSNILVIKVAKLFMLEKPPKISLARLCLTLTRVPLKNDEEICANKLKVYRRKKFKNKQLNSFIYFFMVRLNLIFKSQSSVQSRVGVRFNIFQEV